MDAVLSHANATPESLASWQAIDLSRSIPPQPSLFTPMLQESLERLACRRDIGLLLRNSTAGGTAGDRSAARLWLRSRLPLDMLDERVLVCNGTQAALLLLFEALVGQGGLLAAEALSYGVLSQLAARAHIRVCGVELDDHGIDPSSFEAVCRRHRPKALYCNPTVHNPTASIMPEDHRQAIVDIARHYGVAIIEDEPLGCLHPEAPAPIAAMAPDITWYVAGVTKGLAHGFRIAYLVGPSEREIQEIASAVGRLSYWFPSALSAAVLRDWIESGSADQIRTAISEEAKIRQKMASDILVGLDLTLREGALHGWLMLPQKLDRRELVQKLAQNNVFIRQSDAFAVEPHRRQVNAVRISLSSPLDRQDVVRGLGAIAKECQASM
ncbi:hypothetical protein BJF93_09005 [Xaviernesmea oryzae]|uniref:Aminotransferase class I/classII large domain-containing protein n=1 Tax=Xaviernesmea oryzae TaxID=464029 RepID=A0A1Q9B3Q3_9HYPH|nr:PLP-dependent aminotransferase family protein [Xaviernesmea oryzae]OLP62677.1 hypothetical protein BJF93_09005 [Xaviernesmea oryzae]SEM36153.1 DNA-binding transcriptional regulator, MocR family, contains an aminotransferase domain [Xaviernesmea oryzae]